MTLCRFENFLERMMNLETEIQKQLVFNDSDITDDLQVKDKDRLIARSQQIAEQYDDYDINIANYKEGKQTMRLLNKTSRELNQRRIDMVKDHKRKEKDFKSDVDAIIEPLQNVSKRLKEEINDVDDAMKDKRREKVAQTVHEMCEARNMDDIDVQPKWAEKSMCKRNGEPNSKGLELITDQIKVEQATQERIQMGTDYLKDKADHFGLEESGYINDFKKNPDHENLKSIVEQMKITQQRYQDAIDADLKSKNHDTLVDDKVVNQDTGEVKGKWYYKSVTLSGVESDVDKLKDYAKQLGIDWSEEDK